MILAEKTEIRALSLAGITSVYRRHLKKDFPRSERKPLAMIIGQLLQKEYFAYGLYEEGKLRAYAFFVTIQNEPCLLLDYFAVCTKFRGKGYGSFFLDVLREKLSGYAGILSEAESPSADGLLQDRQVRHRRISFYQNLGFVLSGVSCRLFSVDYDILYLPLSECAYSPEFVMENLRRLYMRQLGVDSFQKNASLYYTNRRSPRRTACKARRSAGAYSPPGKRSP